MLKLFLLIIIFLGFLKADTEKFQVIAENVKSENNIMIATGNVVIFSPTYYITGQRVIYDKEKGTFELFDDVLILKDNNVQMKSDYAFLDVNTDDLYQTPNMFFEQANSVWINSKDSQKTQDLIVLDDAILSSCDCVDPDWSIRVSDAKYDVKDKWINTYNTRLYFKEIPIFYTPYLGFSTDKTRRTGLLTPTIGYSSSEGGFYTQSLFIAPAANYDIELRPQYRAKRGSGLYAYVRYADSIDSVLKISGGYFNEDQRYLDKNNTANSYGKVLDEEHYGLDLEYTKTNLFTKRSSSYKDGLYVDLKYLDDIEYITLEDDSNSDSTVRYVESKINYVFDTPNYLVGSYFRYYIDVDELDNKKTMQELPKLQAHSYSRPLLLDKLLYSSDFKYTNHSQETGITANQYELNIPLTYSFSLFNDYLQLTAKQELVVNKYEYSNFDSTKYDDGTYIESNTTFTLSSDLIKPYENFLHTINLSADYTKTENIKEDGDLYFTSDDSAELSEFSLTKSSDSINFGINQSIYSSSSLTQIINHKLTQSVLYDDHDDLKFENLKNEIIYNYFLGAIKNSLTYNFQDKLLLESSSSFDLSYNDFYIKLGHYMSENADTLDKLSSYQIDTRYKISNDYSIGYSTSYNLEEKLRSKQSFILGIDDKCWNLDIRLEKEITASSGDAIKQDIVYIELFLNPLGGIKQEYEIERDDQ